MDEWEWLRIELRSIHERQQDMNHTLIENTASLKEHMRRTELLEADMKPIKSHVSLMNAAAKIGSIVMGVAIAAHEIGLF